MPEESNNLFGLPADYDAIRPICEKYGLLLLEDGAQGFVGTMSFFPAKPLVCYGDGGAMFTDNDEWAALIRSLCVHGKSGSDKYNNVRLGVNSQPSRHAAGGHPFAEVRGVS